MATAAALCNVGVGAGKNNYKLDYSTGDGDGVTTLTAAQYAASSDISNIMYVSPDGSMMMHRSGVTADPIATNGYPRTEGREMALDGTTERSFARATGDHWCKVIFKVTHLPPKKPSVVVLQMHDESDDVIELAVQPVSGYNEITNPKVELVCRINGTSSGIPKLVADFKYNTVYAVKIRVGAIASGGVGWETYLGDMVTPKIKSSDPGMPAMGNPGGGALPDPDFYPSTSLFPSSADACYFKWGCYLQTKHVGNGTGGLETDINEYGEVGYRDVQTFHNGETVPGVLTFGTQVFDIVSNVRWAVATQFQNTAGDTTGAQNPVPITAALPASLVAGDMMYALVRARRTFTTLPGASSPSSPSTPAGWTRLISTRASATGSSTLVAHTVRFMLFCKKWVPGDSAPIFNYTATTLTDLVTIQLFAVIGGKYSVNLLDLLDAAPAGLDLTNPNDNTLTTTGITYATSASTTVLGPTGTLTAAPGSLALALVSHEQPLASGSVAVVSGGADGLSWVEGGEGILTTAAGSAWANDYAIVPGSGSSVSIAAKTAAATLNATDLDTVTAGTQNGKGWGLLFSLAPAKTHGRRRAN